MVNRSAVALVLASLLVAGPPAGAADTAVCDEAGRQAEQRAGLPAGLLRAIGVVESGRRDPLSGRVQPWPWTIDAAGQGEVFAGPADAVSRTRALLASHITSIDIGCFQINLAAHPEVFQSLEAGFAPTANAAAAADLLRRLHDSTGSWSAAVAAYHSATPRLGAAYRDRVAAIWGQDLSSPGMGVPASVVELRWQPSGPFPQVWTPATAGGAQVIHIAPLHDSPFAHGGGGEQLATIHFLDSQ
jgi:hypothetical protein